MNSLLKNLLLILITLFFGNSCQNSVNDGSSIDPSSTLLSLVQDMPSIGGRNKYLPSPSVTAGNRVYSIGHQDGTFPDLGWHVKGEMGGIWNHPIKLMDGFSAQISIGNESVCLEKASQFISYPIGNERIYSLPNNGMLEIKRFQFVPDDTEGMIVEFVFENKSDQEVEGSFTFNAFTDLSPVWLAEKLNLEDGKDKIFYNEEKGVLSAKDENNDWFVQWGASVKPNEYQKEVSCNYERKGKGTSASLVFPLNVTASGTSSIQFYISGSYNSSIEADKTFNRLSQNAEKMLKSKKERYHQINQTAKLNIPDQKVGQAFEWIKYNTDWLIREVPEVGRALSAGLPDYPWWFGCDNTYSLQGVLATGRPELAKSTLKLIHDLSVQTNDNGRIIHEASTNGVVFNPGNINETPHFAFMLWDYYKWTGDRVLLEEYYPTVKKGMDWLLKENDEDGNYSPEGAGMMEIHGLDSEMIDVAVYTQQGFEAAAKMAEVLGESELSKQYKEKALSLKNRINSDWWVEESNSYADFIATKEKALELVEGAIIRADTLKKPWAVEELEETKKQIEGITSSKSKGYVVHHNWVVNTPLEMGIADEEKALKALETGSKFVNPFGIFVTGIDRDESAGSDDSSFAENQKIFSYVGAVMTLPTGVQAISESNYGRSDEALDYLKRMVNSFSYAFPGGMYEVSPDFGMMVQAWNIYAMAKPIISNFFGVQPEAWRKYVKVQPQLPSNWENVSLEKIIVGDNQISISKSTNGAVITWELTQTKDDWIIDFILKEGQKVKLNGAEVDINENRTLTLTESKNIIEIMN